MDNIHYKKITTKGFDINIKESKSGKYRLYLTKDRIRTGQFVSFKCNGRAEDLEAQAPFAKDHSNLSNALYALYKLAEQP